MCRLIIKSKPSLLKRALPKTIIFFLPFFLVISNGLTAESIEMKVIHKTKKKNHEMIPSEKMISFIDDEIKKCEKKIKKTLIGKLQFSFVKSRLMTSENYLQQCFEKRIKASESKGVYRTMATLMILKEKMISLSKRETEKCEEKAKEDNYSFYRDEILSLEDTETQRIYGHPLISRSELFFSQRVMKRDVRLLKMVKPFDEQKVSFCDYYRTNLYDNLKYKKENALKDDAENDCNYLGGPEDLLLLLTGSVLKREEKKSQSNEFKDYAGDIDLRGLVPKLDDLIGDIILGDRAIEFKLLIPRPKGLPKKSKLLKHNRITLNKMMLEVEKKQSRDIRNDLFEHFKKENFESKKPISKEMRDYILYLHEYEGGSEKKWHQMAISLVAPFLNQKDKVLDFIDFYSRFNGLTKREQKKRLPDLRSDFEEVKGIVDHLFQRYNEIHFRLKNKYTTEKQLYDPISGQDLSGLDKVSADDGLPLMMFTVLSSGQRGLSMNEDQIEKLDKLNWIYNDQKEPGQKAYFIANFIAVITYINTLPSFFKIFKR